MDFEWITEAYVWNKIKGVCWIRMFQDSVFLWFFLEGKERNEVIEVWGMVLHIFNEYKKILFKVKEEL